MKQGIIGIIILVVGGVLLSITMWAGGWLDEALRTLFRPAVPSGAILAFQESKCPDGWDSYEKGAGRFLLGAGILEYQGKTFAYETGHRGGAPEHELTIPELPEHKHGDDDERNLYFVQVTGTHTEIGTDNNENTINIRSGVKMETAGEGKPHSIMPPYRVVNFCKKR